MKAFRSFALVFAILISAVSLLYSQTSEGRILGTVFDQSGAVIAGAKVTITNTATSVSRQLVTTSAGEYVAPNLVYTPDVAAANPVIGSGGSRHIQLAGKIIW